MSISNWFGSVRVVNSHLMCEIKKATLLCSLSCSDFNEIISYLQNIYFNRWKMSSWFNEQIILSCWMRWFHLQITWNQNIIVLKCELRYFLWLKWHFNWHYIWSCLIPFEISTLNDQNLYQDLVVHRKCSTSIKNNVLWLNGII